MAIGPFSNTRYLDDRVITPSAREHDDPSPEGLCATTDAGDLLDTKPQPPRFTTRRTPKKMPFRHRVREVR